MMTLTELIDTHKLTEQQPAHIFGSAPSVKNAKKMRLSGIKIGIGDMPWRAPEFGPYNFWVTSNTWFPLPWDKKHYKIIENTRAKVLISSVCANSETGKNNLNRIISELKKLFAFNNIVMYDHRHIRGKYCNIYTDEPCCMLSRYFNLGDTIQDKLADFTNGNCKVNVSTSAPVNSLILAILLGCNPIYIHGIEIPQKMSEYKYYKNWKNINGFKQKGLLLLQQYLPFYRSLKTDFSGEYTEELLSIFSLIGKTATQSQIQIFSTSETSPLNQLSGYNYLRL